MIRRRSSWRQITGTHRANLRLIRLELTNRCYRFDVQLTAVKERLEAAKVGSGRGGSLPVANGGFGFGATGSRIAKPLRGGGGNGGDTNGTSPAAIPVLSALQGQPTGKRSSWFFKDTTNYNA